MNIILKVILLTRYFQFWVGWIQSIFIYFKGD